MTQVGAAPDLYRATAGLAPGELTEVDSGVVAALPPGCLLLEFGIVPTHIGRGACRAEMTVAKCHLNQSGNAQAGAVVSFADACAGWASYAALDEAHHFTTLELRCSLLRAVAEGDLLVAEARPVHLGRRTLVFDVDVRRSTKPVARFGCTQLVLAATGERVR